MPKRQHDPSQEVSDVPIEELQQRFGSNFKQARVDAGLTQVQASDLSGIDQSVLSKIERGTINPTLATMQRLARIVDDEVANLLLERPAKNSRK